ncbi:MAG: DUF3494 domain-containing protein [Candidatus Marinimicrobia bacterium]|nr:DUF3494 domain-containing protein [Candidatus Neomarinimicrobiota bacterium]
MANKQKKEFEMKIDTNKPTNLLKRSLRFLTVMLTIVFLSTVAMSVSSPSPVNLGTAGDFVILTKTGISNTGTTAIVGDIGVSPESATAITGLGLIMDPSGTFSTSSLLTGNIYAADYTDPTPTKMTTAIGDFEIAYTDAAGRVSPDYIELYTGDLTGQTLTPGLYKWGTAVLVSEGGVTISGTATDVWIFQIAQNLTLSNGAMVHLTGGAQSSNIFWQVAGQVTIGTTAAMRGIILCQTLIEMQTGASLNGGRALAKTAVTLDANAVSESFILSSVENNEVPHVFSLKQNYPNPFNPTTTISYVIPQKSQVCITIYDILGNQITTLINQEQSSGYQEIVWNSKDKNGKSVSAGIYVYQMVTESYRTTKKMVLMK